MFKLSPRDADNLPARGAFIALRFGTCSIVPNGGSTYLVTTREKHSRRRSASASKSITFLSPTVLTSFILICRLKIISQMSIYHVVKTVNIIKRFDQTACARIHRII